MAINTSALSSIRLRLGPTYRGFGGPKALELPGIHSKIKIRFCDLRFCADNNREPGFNSIVHFQRICDARDKKSVPTAILRLLEAGIVTHENNFVALGQGRYCLPPSEEVQLGERTAVLDQDTALIRLTKGFARHFRTPTVSDKRWGLLYREANRSLGNGELLISNIMEMRKMLTEINGLLSPVGLRLSMPTEPTVEIALGRQGAVSQESYSIACSSDWSDYGQPTHNNLSYVLRHSLDAGGRTRSRIDVNTAANFLLQVEIRPKEIA